MLPMQLLILSDLHLEFSNLPFAETEADVIVLAGDISKSDHGIYWARTVWPTKEIIYIAGNHEFYRMNRQDVVAKLRIAAAETGVHFLDTDEVVINDVRFLGSTLWTDFQLYGNRQRDMEVADNTLNDFRLIKEGDREFTPMDSVVLHEESLAWLTQKLLTKNYDGKTVVVSHHLPSILSVAEKYKGDPLNACFASNLDHLFGHADLWIHGHTHDSFDYMVNGTRVICNPRGYSRDGKRNENIRFNPEFIVDLDKPHTEARTKPDINPNKDLINALLGLEKETSDGLEYYDICFLPPELISAYWEERNGSTQPGIKGTITPVFAWDFEPWRDRLLVQLGRKKS